MIYVLISQWVWRTSTDVRLADYERLYCAQSCHSNENPFTEVSYLAGGKNQIKILKWFPLFNLIEHHYLAEDCPALGVGVEVGWDCTGRKETGRVKAVAHAHVPARAHTQTDR